MNSPIKLPRALTYLIAAPLVLPILFSAAWAQHVQFTDFGGLNGAQPWGGVVVDAAGNVYGTTRIGGSSRLGVVYEMSPGANGRAVETVLYNFTGSNGDGANPKGDLIFDNGGNLYGITQAGGALNLGTVFELSPPVVQGGAWTETVLYSFQGMPSDGAHPMAGLVVDTAGNMYGTTSMGGIDADSCVGGCGIVFELSPPSEQGGAWAETVLYMFQGVPDGLEPLGALIFDMAGNPYGTTLMGWLNAGTVFELSPPVVQGGAWSETILRSFVIKTDGAAPEAGLALGPNGALFGTNSEGAPAGSGTVFKLFPPSQPGGNWMFTVIYNPPGPSFAAVTVANANTLYGINGSTGGTSIFRISDLGGGAKVTTFFFSAGLLPFASLTIYNGGLYGTDTQGGYQNSGSIFRVTY